MSRTIGFPEATCDTHIHFYDHRYPTAPKAQLHPPDADVEAYQRFADAVGIGCAVVVQPTTYGFDNRCQLVAMAALTASGTPTRGMMVVDDTAPDSELDRLTELGVRGARFHRLPGGPSAGRSSLPSPLGSTNSGGTSSSNWPHPARPLPPGTTI